MRTETITIRIDADASPAIAAIEALREQLATIELPEIPEAVEISSRSMWPIVWAAAFLGGIAGALLGALA